MIHSCISDNIISFVYGSTRKTRESSYVPCKSIMVEIYIRENIIIRIGSPNTKPRKTTYVISKRSFTIISSKIRFNKIFRHSCVVYSTCKSSNSSRYISLYIIFCDVISKFCITCLPSKSTNNANSHITTIYNDFVISW